MADPTGVPKPLDLRIIDTNTGELLRHLTLDPRRDYQPIAWPSCGCLRCLATSISDVSRHHMVGPAGLEPATERLLVTPQPSS